MEKTYCKNCGHPIDSPYCPVCGQRYIQKHTWSDIWQSLVESFELRSGFLYNVKSLTFRPGKALAAYLNGSTRPFQNPFSYLFITFAINFFWPQFVDLIGITNSIMSVRSENSNVILVGIMITLVPSIAVVSTIVLYKRFTFVENLLAGILITAQWLLFKTVIEMVLIPLNFRDFDIVAGSMLFVYYAICLAGIQKASFKLKTLRALSGAILLPIVFIALAWLLIILPQEIFGLDLTSINF